MNFWTEILRSLNRRVTTQLEDYDETAGELDLYANSLDKYVECADVRFHTRIIICYRKQHQASLRGYKYCLMICLMMEAGSR